MAGKDEDPSPETVPLTNWSRKLSASFSSTDTMSSDGSLFGDDDGDIPETQRLTQNNARDIPYRDVEDDVEAERGDELFQSPTGKSKKSHGSRLVWVAGILCLGGWIVAFVLFWGQRHNNLQTDAAMAAIHDADSVKGASSYGKPLSINGIISGFWSSKQHSISWIAGPDGQDGLLLERGEDGNKAYLRVENVRNRQNDDHREGEGFVLMRSGSIQGNGRFFRPSETWPSPDFKNVLLMADREKNWRYSSTGTYWLFDVETQTAQPLDPDVPEGRIQLASWSPKSNAVVFTRDSNMYIRKLDSKAAVQLTANGGKDLFYGIPDWVYEEEVFTSNSATWWSNDGKYVAFLRTNETKVPEYTIQYHMSRPSGKSPAPGLEAYPENRQIKYPKAGAPNPVVTLEFYDVDSGDVFSVDVAGGFADDDRLITEVVWASNGKVLVKESNRESDIVHTVLIDVISRTGRRVRIDNIAQGDGGWAEVTESTTFIPKDPAKGRPEDGYIDVIVHNGYDHFGYFTPLDNPNPIPLTSGPWEIIDSPPTVDLNNGIVYFLATKESPNQKHVYSVKLDGSDLKPVTDVSKPGFYDVSFSSSGGYALLSYQGPQIPWQKLINTPSNQDTFEEIIENNEVLADRVRKYALPTKIYENITIDGFTFQVLERRPPHFNPIKKYPVLFYLYGGPNSQTVSKKFSVDFQSYVASTLGYIVVTVDGRGTGQNGRAARTAVRGNLGYWEAHDQIETAKAWSKKPYVDKDHMAIWGWSYGGFMALKTLEQDGGQTFQYGMAVAPVTDWRFYDSIYTERYMRTPANNPTGYETSAISNMTALQQNVRFLVMQGTADDNVHFQNTLALLDKLDMASVENYDVHVFPDSDHSIYFHNGLQMVYNRLASWLVNAFTDEWHQVGSALPKKY